METADIVKFSIFESIVRPVNFDLGVIEVCQTDYGKIVLQLKVKKSLFMLYGASTICYK